MDTWWIDEPHLLGSGNPSVSALEQLRREGFGVLVSLLDEMHESPRYAVGCATALGFERHNIAVGDFQPPTVDQLEQFVTLIAGLPAGSKTVMHCKGGSGRTGTFAVAYWVAEGLPLHAATQRVRKARPGAVETPEQEAVLEQFAAEREPWVDDAGRTGRQLSRRSGGRCPAPPRTSAGAPASHE